MKERPILFSASMVRASFEGEKTQTRRVMKPQPSEYFDPGPVEWGPEIFGASDENEGYKSPYGAPGDRLWVRETHLFRHSGKTVVYREQLAHQMGEADAASFGAMYGGWKPASFMPRWASRITLEIEEVRVERVAEISEHDAMEEGAGVSLAEHEEWDGDPDCYRKLFRELWNLLNAKHGFGWDAPLVYRLSRQWHRRVATCGRDNR